MQMVLLVELHGRPAEHADGSFVPYCQPLGDHIMLRSPRGWLVSLLRAQRADHADGVVRTIVPALRRSYTVPRSQELACCWWNGMVGPLNTQMAALCHVASPWEII
ncbi:hypothetical protein N7465_007350 [Penicillium sp. CMV-2018d]|nr:hypothetical protein N7465_007350 [Penicillium sp. CMV-2018d]